MIREAKSILSQLCDTARRRLLTVKGDPFLVADWERVLFFHYLFDPEQLRPAVPAPFELELYHGEACVSLVAVTMRRFRPYRPLSECSEHWMSIREAEPRLVDSVEGSTRRRSTARR